MQKINKATLTDALQRKYRISILIVIIMTVITTPIVVFFQLGWIRAIDSEIADANYSEFLYELFKKKQFSKAKMHTQVFNRMHSLNAAIGFNKNQFELYKMDYNYNIYDDHSEDFDEYIDKQKRYISNLSNEELSGYSDLYVKERVKEVSYYHFWPNLINPTDGHYALLIAFERKFKNQAIKIVLITCAVIIFSISFSIIVTSVPFRAAIRRQRQDLTEIDQFIKGLAMSVYAKFEIDKSSEFKDIGLIKEMLNASSGDLSRQHKTIQRDLNINKVFTHQVCSPMQNLQIVLNDAEKLSQGCKELQQIGGGARDTLNKIMECVRFGMKEANKAQSSMKTATDLFKKNVRLFIEPCDITEIVQDAIASANIFFSSNKKTECILNLNHSRDVNGEKSKIIDIFDTIIGNAYRQTADVESVIHISTRNIKKGGTEYLEATISNNNSNLYGCDKDEMFGFGYTTNKKKNGKNGMGIGLALAKKNVELHSGHIAVTDSSNSVTFTFTLAV